MKNTSLTPWVILVCVLAVLTYSFTCYNDLTRTENQVRAVISDTKNVHASFVNGIQSQGLAVEKYGEMVVQVCTATYGQGGAKAAVLLLQKQNPDVDASVIVKLQVAIEAGYARFEQAQRTRIDIVRTYENMLDTLPSSVVASILGFPKRVTREEMEKIVTSAATKKAFETGEMEPVSPFGK